VKIRSKLSLTFSVIASFLFVIFGITIYLFSAYHRENEFFEHLLDRVKITENFFLEKDSFTSVEYEKIRTQFLHTLPQETEEIIEVEENVPLVYKYAYADVHKAKFLEEESYNFNDNQKQGHSGLFTINGTKYLIIVVAEDEVGLQNLSFLKYTILFIVCIGIPFLFLGSFLVTKRALIPLVRKIQKADSISATSLHKRLNVDNANDEIGELAIAFNRLLDRLEASFESQKSFISNASHEIRNPLTAILGEAEIAISKSRSEEEYVESLKSVLREADKLNSTVNNLLQLSKVTASGERLKFESIRLDMLLTESIEAYEFTNEEHKIEFSIELTDVKIPTVYGNKGLLKSVVINLLDNACKFSSNDVVKVALTNHENLFTVKFEDLGIGIPAADLDKVKGAFYRGENTIAISGSGIGLALSSKIIQLHSGTIQIESELNVGTQVSIIIPRLH